MNDPKYGPGYHRMTKFLGRKRQEALRLQTVAEQDAAFEEVAQARAARDRATYRDYPAPKK